MRKTYYTIETEIAAGWTLPVERSLKATESIVSGHLDARFADVSKWSVPPHVKFANLGYDRKRPISASVKRFSDELRKRYRLEPKGFSIQPGYASVAEIYDFAKQYGVVGTVDNEPSEPGDRFEIPTVLFGYVQDSFRSRWQRGEANAVWFPLGGENADEYTLPMRRATNGFQLRPADLMTYMYFLLSRDLEEKQAHVCQNARCNAPYFIGRVNKIFCSRKCASFESVQRWRKRHS